MKELYKKFKSSVLLLPAIVIFGLLVRIFRLDYLPVFADEAIYIRWSQIMAAESTLRFLPLSDGKQPLFMWVTIPFLKVISDPLIAGRLVSVLAGIGTIVGIFLVSYFHFKSQKAALISAFIWVISPFAFFFDRLALVDSMLTFFGIWTYLLTLITVKTKRLDLAIITGFFLGCAVLTKSTALFFVLLLPTIWMLNNDQDGLKKRRVYLIKASFLTLIIYLIAFMMYNILRLGPNFHLLALRSYDYVYPYSHILKSPLDPLLGHFGGIRTYFTMLAPSALTFLALFGIISNIRKSRNNIVLLALWIVIPLFLIAEYSKTVTARYILFVLPFVAVLGGSSLLTKQKLFSSIALGGLLVFILQSLFINYKFVVNIKDAPLPQGERSGYLEEWTAGDGIREVAEIIKSEHKASPEVQIVIGTEGYFGTLPNGLEMYLQGVPNVIVKGIGIGIVEIPDSLKDSKEAGNETYLLINKSRLSVNPEKLGAELVAVYPKVFRTPGTIEYNTKGPQEILYLFKL